MICRTRIFVLSAALLFPALIGCRSGGRPPAGPGPQNVQQSPVEPAPPVALPDPQPEPADLPAAPTFGGVTTELVPGEEPNRYSVRLSWRAPTGVQGYCKVMRSEGEGGAVLVDVVPVDREQIVDEAVQAAREYSYSVEFVGSETSQVLGDGIRVAIPRDLVIEGVQNAADVVSASPDGAFRIESFHRVFFKEGARLLSGSQPLYIVAAELRIEGRDGARIETFAEGATAAPGENGLAGGDISISVSRGAGLLRVIARGQNGGDGAAGANGADGAQGAPGERAMARIKAGQVLECLRRAGFGKRGGNGTDGGNGKDGGQGGASGRVLVRIAEPSAELTIDPRAIAGQGGKGGRPGRGGKGGRGGPLDFFPAPNIHNPCMPLVAYDPDSNSGTPGRDGFAGRDGAPGQTEPACADLGGIKIGC